MGTVLDVIVLGVTTTDPDVRGDATERTRGSAVGGAAGNAVDGISTAGIAPDKVRVQLDAQLLQDPQGTRLALAFVRHAEAEINQGKRTVPAYLRSPVQQAVKEAA